MSIAREDREHRRSSFRAAIRGARPLRQVTTSDGPPPLSHAPDTLQALDLPLPDLLWAEPSPTPDQDALSEVLDLAFMGRETGPELNRVLEEDPVPPSTWRSHHFASDLYVDELVVNCLQIHHHGRDHRIHPRYQARVLCQPPTDLETISFRQDILRSLTEDNTLRVRVEDLHHELSQLVELFSAARSDARLNHASFRLEILRQARQVIETMVRDFDSTACGLRRLFLVAQDMQKSSAYHLLEAVLDYEGKSGQLSVSLNIGADGRARQLRVISYQEERQNRYYRPPWRRWVDLLNLFWRRASLDEQLIVDGIIYHAYSLLAPAVRSLLHIQLQLELYLANLGFRESAAKQGLCTCLAHCGNSTELSLSSLFNPLLINTGGPPVPADVGLSVGSTTLVTGPNSGGKTRLLQAVGLVQLLGQGGFYCPAAAASVPVLNGLFACLVDRHQVDQPEGRLGTELLRIKTLFAQARPQSMVLLDELCSGTNPSEATEIVSMVLELLRRLDAVALVSTHFLDYALTMLEDSRTRGVRFLQVEVDAAHRTTFGFVPGVASSSLAATTARRLGVTFEELATAIGAKAHRI